MKLKGEEERLELEDRLGERIDLLRRRSWREQKRRERKNERKVQLVGKRTREREEREGRGDGFLIDELNLPPSLLRSGRDVEKG